MLAIIRIVKGGLCGVLLVLGSVQAAHVYAETSTGYHMNEGRSERTVDHGSQSQIKEKLGGIQTMQGEALQVKRGSNFIKDPNAKEPRLILDLHTQKLGRITLGDRTERKVESYHQDAPTTPSTQVRDIVPIK